ncbi:MauE/DoxX family redox-associated membrane protein [Streptosporangium sp. NPDC000396]|uniref:MauE/DoxX family redox-associated membrane protein n=1 Tax=Streptosporangium sp. NPDC000396 TaxID=3366185 RepID=UPI00369BA117
MRVQYVALGCRVFLGITFVIAAFGKLRSRSALAEFTDSLSAWGWAFLPVHGHRFVALAVGLVEVAVVVLLAFDVTARVGFMLALAVLLVFTTALGSALRGNRRIRCNCFGRSGADISAVHLVRNVILTVTAGLGVTAYVSEGASIAVESTLVTLAVAVIGAVVVTRLDDLAFLAGR